MKILLGLWVCCFLLGCSASTPPQKAGAGGGDNGEPGGDAGLTSEDPIVSTKRAPTDARSAARNDGGEARDPSTSPHGGVSPTGTIVQLGTPAGDFANAVALDSQGNCYVLGATQGTMGDQHFGGADLFLIKVSPAGKPLWSRQLGGRGDDIGRAIAVDEQDNIYVAGTAYNDFDGHANAMPGRGDVILAKYGPTGEKVWTRMWGTAYDEYTWSMAYRNNQLYIAGADLAGEMIFVVQYSTGGQKGWDYSLLGGEYLLQASTIDTNGITYIAGLTYSTEDVFVITLDPYGEKMATHTFGTTGRDEARGIAYDESTGDVFITGMTGHSSSADGDAFIARLTPDLQPKWLQKVATDKFDQGHGLALDKGKIYIAGRLNSTFLPTTSDGDAFLAQFDTSGKLAWKKEWTSPMSEFATAVAARNGAICLVGSTHDRLGSQAYGNYDAFLIQLSP